MNKLHQIILLAHIYNQWPLDNTGLTAEQNETAIEVLIAKGYIKDENTATAEGAKAIHRVEEALMNDAEYAIQP